MAFFLIYSGPTESKILKEGQELVEHSDDVDMNCGGLLDGKATLVERGERISQVILKTASGRKPQNEKHGFSSLEFNPWSTGAVL
jgi:altronate dehydratase